MQEPAGFSTIEDQSWHGEGLRCAEEREGRQGHAGSARRDRQGEVGRSECPRSGARDQHDRRYSTQHGNHGGRLSRTHMAKQSKRYRALASQRTEDTVPLAAAVEKLKKFGNTKFDQTVEIHMRLGVDPKQADQIIRGSVVLPHGIGRTQRVAVFAKGDMATAATEAGADVVGQEELAQKIKDGLTEFDVCIAAPDMMGLVGPLGKVLGPRGLMPSPRAGTVTPDVAKVVKEYKAGKVEFRIDNGGIVNEVVGDIRYVWRRIHDSIETLQ